MGQAAIAYPGLQMKQRQTVYGMLGSLFEREITLPELHAIGLSPCCDTLSELARSGVATRAAQRIVAYSSHATESSLADVHAEFDALFRSPDHIYACASCWAAGAPDVAGPAWERALEFYRHNGVSVRSDRACVADHAGFELHVAALLAARGCEAHTTEEARAACEALRDLLDALILPWFPEFLRAVEQDRRARFYREVACLAREFLDFEWSCLGSDTPAMA